MTADLSRLVTAIRSSSPEPRIRLRQGVVQAVAADGSCTVTIGGGSQQVPGVAVLGSCCPIPGASVWLATDGRDLFVVGAITPTGPAYGAVRQSAAQSVPNTTWTAVDWTTRTDTVAVGVTVGNAGLTCVVPGLYQVTGSVAFAANATGERHARLLVNGSVVLAGTSAPGWATLATLLRADGVVKLAPGDVVNLAGYQASGGALSTAVAVGQSLLRMVWVGPTT